MCSAGEGCCALGEKRCPQFRACYTRSFRSSSARISVASRLCQESCETPPPRNHLKFPPLGKREEKGAMEGSKDRVVSLPTEAGSAEERMLGADLVREMVARKERGEGV